MDQAVTPGGGAAITPQPADESVFDAAMRELPTSSRAQTADSDPAQPQVQHETARGRVLANLPSLNEEAGDDDEGDEDDDLRSALNGFAWRCGIWTVLTTMAWMAVLTPKYRDGDPLDSKDARKVLFLVALGVLVGRVLVALFRKVAFSSWVENFSIGEAISFVVESFGNTALNLVFMCVGLYVASASANIDLPSAPVKSRIGRLRITVLMCSLGFGIQATIVRGLLKRWTIIKYGPRVASASALRRTLRTLAEIAETERVQSERERRHNAALKVASLLLQRRFAKIQSNETAGGGGGGPSSPDSASQRKAKTTRTPSRHSLLSSKKPPRPPVEVVVKVEVVKVEDEAAALLAEKSPFLLMGSSKKSSPPLSPCTSPSRRNLSPSSKRNLEAKKQELEAAPETPAKKVEGPVRLTSFDDATSKLHKKMYLGPFGCVSSPEHCAKVARRLFRLLHRAEARLKFTGAGRQPYEAVMFPLLIPQNTRSNATISRQTLLGLFLTRALGVQGDDPLRGLGSAKQRRATFDELFPRTLAEVAEEDMILAVQRVYEERRFLAATIDAFGHVNVVLTRFGEVVWAFISLVVCMVIWRVTWNEVIVSAATVAVVASFSVGQSASQLCVGLVFILFTNPYDIGDRVLISEPTSTATTYPFIVAKLQAQKTTFMTSHGEQLIIANYVLAQKAITNHTRSPSPWCNVNLRLSTRTPPAEISKLAGAICDYVKAHPSEWCGSFLFFTGIEHDKGAIVLDAWMASTNPYHDFEAVFGSRSKVFLFLQAYIYEAGLHFLPPTQPWVDVTNSEWAPSTTMMGSSDNVNTSTSSVAPGELPHPPFLRR